MDATKIVVLVMTLCAVAFLVWVEVNSRRNNKALKDQSKQLNEKSQ